MSNDYRSVADALKAGADPAHLCMTCPWDRFCITPPTMTEDDVKRKIDEAHKEDELKDPEHKKVPFGSLLTTMFMAGKDMTAECCPVFTLRLRSSTGRDVSDQLKEIMKAVE